MSVVLKHLAETERERERDIQREEGEKEGERERERDREMHNTIGRYTETRSERKRETD